jgi:hypothetical protein
MSEARITMSDEEIICQFMEPRPKPRGLSVTATWWTTRTLLTGTGPGGHFGSYQVAPLIEICPAGQRLGMLYEVEERLTGEQWCWYEAQLRRITGGTPRQIIHASAAQKIKALAAVLRSSDGDARG